MTADAPSAPIAGPVAWLPLPPSCLPIWGPTAPGVPRGGIARPA
jgi:hypothetical protein